MASNAQMVDDELPYNGKNILLQKEDVNAILSKYGVEGFTNLDMYRKAFVHKSYCTRKNENFINGNEQCPSNCIPLQEDSNERLEFMGDAVLAMVVAKYLYERYPYENEGFLTKMRTKLVNGVMLASLSKTVGLQKYILLSKQIEENDGRNNKNILEDTFESFIAAVFTDFNDKKIKSKNYGDVSGMGFQIAEKWIVNVIETHVDFAELVRMNNNYKDMLIKFYQHNFQVIPRFFEVNVVMESNRKMFTVCIKNEVDTVVGVGKGDSKKKAEQAAAYQALLYHGQITADTGMIPTQESE
jgi:ribonuclease-3